MPRIMISVVVALTVFYFAAIWAVLPVVSGVRMLATVEGGEAVEVLVFTGINTRNLALDLGAAALAGSFVPGILIALLDKVSNLLAGRLDDQKVRRSDGDAPQPDNG